MIEKIEVNLIPGEYVIKDTRISADLGMIAALLLSCIFVVAALIWSSHLESEIFLVKGKIANTEREIEVNKTIQDEIKTLEGKQREMQAKVNGLKSVNINRAKWVDAFELYTSILPENTWLTSIDESEDGMNVNINGMTEADAEVGLIMNRLSGSPLVGNVVLVEIKDAGRNGQLKSFNLQHSFVRGN